MRKTIPLAATALAIFGLAASVFAAVPAMVLSGMIALSLALTAVDSHLSAAPALSIAVIGLGPLAVSSFLSIRHLRGSCYGCAATSALIALVYLHFAARYLATLP